MSPLKALGYSIVLIITAAGCAKDGGSGGAAACDRCATAITTQPTGLGNDSTVSGYTGSTVAMTNYSGLRDFFYVSRPQLPTNVRINIDIARASDSVVISYVDQATGRLVEAGDGIQHPITGIQDNTYNKWYSENGQWVYKGFFQDGYGAIILIVNRSLSQGDGVPARIVGGEVWYQNFESNYPSYWAQGPLKMCWQITIGPYDCRSFIVFPGNKYEQVYPTLTATPQNIGPDRHVYYRKLGDFDGIDATAANFPTTY